MEFEILYTHQKTKKAKTWQDGFLRMPPPKSQAKAVLFSDNKMRLQSFLPKKPKYEVGDEIETERYLIQIDNLCSTPIATSLSSQDSQPDANSEVTPSPPVRPRHDGGQEQQKLAVIKANPLRVGLKRKRTGFVVPRQVKPSQAHVGEDDYAESVTGNLIPANLPPQPLARLSQPSLYTSVQVINATSADKNESISSIINTRQEMLNSRQYPPSKRPDVQQAEVQPAPYSEDNQMTWEELKKDMMSNSKYKSKAPRAGQWKPPTGHSELVVPKPNDTTLSSSLTNSDLLSRADEDDGLMSLPEPYEASTPVVTPGVNHSESLTDTSSVSLPPSPPPARTQKRSLQDIMMLINAPKDVKLNHADQEVAPAAGNAASPQVSLSPSLDGAYDEGIISYSPEFLGESSFHDPINEFNNFKSNSFDSYGDKISEPRCLDEPKPEECSKLHDENNTCDDDDILYRNSTAFDESCVAARRYVPDSGKEMDDDNNAFAVSMAMVSPNSSMVADTACNNSIPGLKPGYEAASPDVATLHDHDGGILASSHNKSPGLLVDQLDLTSVDRSPGFLVEKSPGSFVQSSPDSYVGKSHGSCIERSPGSSVEKSPGSCVEKSPGSFVEKSPGSCVEKSPGFDVEKSPRSCVEKSPGSFVEMSPGSCVEKSPGFYVEKSPGSFVEKSPGSFVEKSPGSCVEKSPGSSVDKSPGSCVQKSPGSSRDKLTIASYNRAPVPYAVDKHTPHSNQERYVTPAMSMMEKPVIATQSYGIHNAITSQQDSTTDIKLVSSQETNTSLIDEVVVNPRDEEELTASDRMLVIPGGSSNDLLSQSSHQHTASTPIDVTDAGHSNALPADHHKKSPDTNAGALSNNVSNEGANFFSPMKVDVDVVRSNSDESPATNFTTSPENIQPVIQLSDSITTPNTSPVTCPEEETSRADHTVPDLSCQAQIFSGYSQEDVCFDLQFDMSQMDSDCGGQEGAQKTYSTEVNEGLLCDANICGPIAVSNGRLSPAIVPFMDSANSLQSATEHVRIADNCTSNGVASLDHDAMVVVDGANSSFDSAHPPHILQTGPSNLRDIQFSPDDCTRDIDESSSSEPFNDIPTQHNMGSMLFKVDPATTSDNTGKVQNQPHIDTKQDALQENLTSDDSQVANLLFQQNTSPTDTLLAGIDTTECNPGHKVVARNFHCVDVTDETESSEISSQTNCH